MTRQIIGNVTKHNVGGGRYSYYITLRRKYVKDYVKDGDPIIVKAHKMCYRTEDRIKCVPFEAEWCATVVRFGTTLRVNIPIDIVRAWGISDRMMIVADIIRMEDAE